MQAITSNEQHNIIVIAFDLTLEHQPSSTSKSFESLKRTPAQQKTALTN
jgi:hypothetical protein